MKQARIRVVWEWSPAAYFQEMLLVHNGDRAFDIYHYARMYRDGPYR